MEIALTFIGAFVGALLGAVASYFISEYFHRQSQIASNSSERRITDFIKQELGDFRRGRIDQKKLLENVSSRLIVETGGNAGIR